MIIFSDIVFFISKNEHTIVFLPIFLHLFIFFDLPTLLYFLSSVDFDKINP